MKLLYIIGLGALLALAPTYAKTHSTGYPHSHAVEVKKRHAACEEFIDKLVVAKANRQASVFRLPTHVWVRYQKGIVSFIKEWEKQLDTRTMEVLTKITKIDLLDVYEIYFVKNPRQGMLDLFVMYNKESTDCQWKMFSLSGTLSNLIIDHLAKNRDA